MDYTFFDYWAAKLEWEDKDVIEMVARRGSKAERNANARLYL